MTMRHASAEQQRHRVLAGISRSRLLVVLREAHGPMKIGVLADAVSLHPNTVREHLEQLAAVGLVLRETATPIGRGRPGLCYSAAPAATDDNAEAYRALAGVLAAELASYAGGDVAARMAGERWGETVVRRSCGSADAPDAVDELVRILDDAGFGPDREGATIRLHRCPFGSLARERGDVVCNVHLGLMRGALRELGAPDDALSLEAFVEPNLCVAHLKGSDRRPLDRLRKHRRIMRSPASWVDSGAVTESLRTVIPAG